MTAPPATEAATVILRWPWPFATPAEAGALSGAAEGLIPGTPAERLFKMEPIKPLSGTAEELEGFALGRGDVDVVM